LGIRYHRKKIRVLSLGRVKPLAMSFTRSPWPWALPEALGHGLYQDKGPHLTHMALIPINPEVWGLYIPLILETLTDK
jgi:hypothetical protein